MHEMSGSVSSAVLVRSIFALLEPNEMKGQRALSFPPPKGYISRNISLLDGKLSTHIPYVTEWFRKGTEPRTQSRAFEVILIDNRTGLIADDSTPPRYLSQKTVVSLKPEFAQWALQSGLPVAPAQNSLGEKSPVNRNRQVRIISPPDGLTYIINPDQDRKYQSIALKADINPPVSQIVWYVDGEPYMIADYPYTVRWYLHPGLHKIKFKVVYMPVESSEVSIRVR